MGVWRRLSDGTIIKIDDIQLVEPTSYPVTPEGCLVLLKGAPQKYHLKVKADDIWDAMSESLGGDK